ncbi:MAG: gamma-glutamyl-gamma-aminobutyrate hydrolase family protein [Candidatus Methylomirabilales bacterium]
MIIALSMRITVNDEYFEMRDAISHDWVKTLDRLGVTPVLIPNSLCDPARYLETLRPQGLLLTGGNDVGPLPGEAEGNTASPRDSTEIALLDAGLRNRVPIFGVCRGLHVINSYFGGRVVRDLGRIAAHVNVHHPIEIVARPCRSMEAFQDVITNSYHKQGVLLDGLSPDLRTFAIATGGVIEGLYHPNLPIVAVQWHPERENPAADLDRALLEDWLAKCE